MKEQGEWEKFNATVAHLSSPRQISDCFTAWLAKRDQERDAALVSDEKRNSWKAVLIEALMVNFILNHENENDPKKALNDLISWETKVALDPRVSSDAGALRAALLEECLRAARDAYSEAQHNGLDAEAAWNEADEAIRSLRPGSPCVLDGVRLKARIEEAKWWIEHLENGGDEVLGSDKLRIADLKRQLAETVDSRATK